MIKNTVLPLCVALLCATTMQAQNTFSKGALNTGIPAANFEVFRAENGLIAHRVAGAIGSFGAADQWIGIGRPLTRLYGYRSQWAGQALTMSLQDRDGNIATAGDKDAEIQWGNQPGTQFNFNYITNPASPTSIRRLMQLRDNGQIFMSDNVSESGSSFGKLYVRGAASGRNMAIYATADGTSTDGGWGLYSIVGGTSPQGVYGVDAVAGAESSPLNVAVRGRFNFDPSIESNTANYAIFGDAAGSPNTNFWAGYFNGRTFCNAGVWTSSDAKLKTGVKQETGALEKIMQLRPATYTYKKAEYPGMSLPAELQHGFIAQEMEKVFPEFVTEVNGPVGFDKAGRLMGMMDFKAINYTALVPVLTAAIQQQQEQLQSQNQEMEQYRKLTEKLLQRLDAMEQVVNVRGGAYEKAPVPDGALLLQNTPNPANGNTVIRYFIPAATAANAGIAVTDASGRAVLQFNNLEKGVLAPLTINAGALQPGAYVYTLVIGGVTAESRQLIIGR